MFIKACKICGIVISETETTAYTEDVISHDTCDSKACQSNQELMYNGFIPLKRCATAWCEIKGTNEK